MRYGGWSNETPDFSRAEYWYTPAIHFAVREGRLEAVQLLLDAGADPEWNGLHDGSLIAMARDRGHAEIARLLEEARDRRGRVLPGSDSHPIHAAITREDTKEVRRLLDANPGLVDVGNEIGASPLHRRSAVAHTSSPRCCSIAAPTCMLFSAPRAASAEGSGPIFRRSISPSGTGAVPETAA